MKKFILIVAIFLSTSSQTLFAQLPSYVPRNGLVGWWPFNGNANDQSGNNLNGTITGATLTSDRNGITNGAYLFNSSVTSNISIQTQSVTGTGLQNQFSIVMWVKSNRAANFISESSLCPGSVSVPMANSNQNWAFVPGNFGTNLGVGFSIGTNGIMVAEHAGNLLDSRLSNSSTYSGFVQVAIVYDTNNSYLYVNGTLVRSRSMYCNSNLKMLPSLLSLGSSLYSPNFSGVIDDLGVWNRALTSSEIQQLYTECSTVAPTGTTTQSFCEGATVANLTATGTGIKWYAAATGGTALANSTTLVNGSTYYATQTVNGCESVARLAVQVNVNNPTLTASATTICAESTVSLTVNSNIPPTTQFSVGDIGPSGGYVFYDQGSVINGWRYLEAYPRDNGSDSGIESYCNAIPNTSNAIGAGLTNTINFIASGNIGNWLATVVAIQLNTSNNWYIPSKDELNLMYTNLKRNNLGNFQDIQYWSSSPASYGSCGINGGVWVQNFANGSQTSEYRNGYQGAGNLRLIRQFSSGTPATTYLWSTGEETNTITPSPTQTTTYWVDVTANGVTCRRSITITVNTTPAPTGAATQNLCNGGTIANLSATGTNIKWYETATGGTPLLSSSPLTNGKSYFASQTVNGCESKQRLRVVTCPNAFITSWQIDTPNQTITLPIQVGNYTYTVNWGDGTNGTYSSTTPAVKTYQQPGQYNVSISGSFNQFKLSGSSSLIGVVDWSDREWVSMDSMFTNCTRFNAIPATSPNLSKLTDMYATFSGATLFNQNISSWNVSNVTRMAYAFQRASNFNQDISSWNVSNVTSMDSMFHSASRFNQNISSWNVGKVLDMSFMFFNATSFNQPIGSWNVSNVVSMASMFGGATSFNRSLNNWNVTKVTNASNLFNGATSFNQNISNWCTQSNINTTNWKLNSPISQANSPNWGTCFSPTGSTTQTLCPGATVSNLTATGTAIKWYATATGGTALESNTVLTNNTTYFASQTINNVESLTRLAVTVVLNSSITPLVSVTTLAGSDFARDGMGIQAQFNLPYGTAIDNDGNLYTVDTYNNRIRKITPSGIVTTLAGSGLSGFADGAGTEAEFNWPIGITVDVSNNVYVTEIGNNRIRKITPAGVVSTLAGSTRGYEDGSGANAKFSEPRGITVDLQGTIYVADFGNDKIRKITPTGVVTTLAGSIRGFADGTGTTAQFNLPYGITVDSNGIIYVADMDNDRIRRVTPTGVVTTIAGSSRGYVDGNGVNAKFSQPRGITIDSLGNIFISDTSNQRIRKITPSGTVTTVAGSGASGFADGIGTSSIFFLPRGLAVDRSGNLYVSDTENNRIRKVTSNGTVTTLAGSNRIAIDGTAENAQFNSPTGITRDTSGNIYVADTFNHRIRKISPDGLVTTLAGSTAGYADGTGTGAQFNLPWGVAVDALGNVFVADRNNNRIRKITPNGVVTTIAGSTRGLSDGNGTSAQFNGPSDIALDAAGNIYVADTFNHQIRKITPTGVVSTIAGSTVGFVDGIGTSAKFNTPFGLAVDRTGTIYVADTSNNKIRKISSSGDVTTLAGTNFGFLDGDVSVAQFGSPYRLELDETGSIYVSDSNNNRIRKISTSGVVTTIAGTTSGFAEGDASSAKFSLPYGISIDPSGNLYVADYRNSRIRKITISTAPKGVTTQTFCSGSTIANLIATGTNIKWYSNAIGGSVLATSTPLVNNTTYYASQTVNGCESIDRLAVYVVINDPQIQASATTICFGNSVALNAFDRNNLQLSSASNNFPPNLQNGLLGYWPFNGNANDISVNQRNGLVNGALLTSDRNGNQNSAYSFTTNQDITIPNTSNLNSYPLTVSLWYNVSTLSQTVENSNIFSKYVPGTWNGFQILLSDSRNVTSGNTQYNDGYSVNSWYIKDNSNRVLGYYGEKPFLQSNIQTNTWYHYVFTLDSSGGKIYVNNKLVDSHPWTGNPGASTNNFLWKIGGLYNTWFNGKIDDIGVWNRALSQNEIQSLYNASKTSYLWSTGATTATINPTPTQTTDYWVDITTNGVTCRRTITITVNNTPAPTGTAIQTFCNSATIAGLTAVGTGIKWYATASGGNPLASTTALVNSTTYYASQTLNGCESIPRLAVNVTIFSTLPPTGNTTQTLCEGSTLSNFTVTGSGIKWYDAATGGTLLATNSVIVNNTTYFATQTLNGCESISRLAVRGQISSFPNANLITSGSTILRVNELVTISTVSSSAPLTYKWFKDGVLLPNSTNSSYRATTSGKYNVEITNATGCTSKSIEIPVYVLSQTNYNVSASEETCLNAKNGKINVKTSLELPYRGTLLLNGVILQTKAFNRGEIIFDNLSGGTYSLCITVDQQTDYKECFEIKVNKPQELSVFSTLSNNSINISLNGANSYQVNLNGKITITKSNQITLPLQSGINNLSVSTDKNCQGVYSESFAISDQISVYPNPFTDELSIQLPETILTDSTTKVSIKVSTLNGAIIYQSEKNKSEDILKLNLGHLASGVYLLHIDNTIYKIIKK